MSTPSRHDGHSGAPSSPSSSAASVSPAADETTPPAIPALRALFDWDGVILDSSRQHARSWEALAAETGHTLPDGHFERGFGMKNESIIPDLLGWTRDPEAIRRLSLRKEELYRDVIRAEGIDPLPGVRTFLERLRAAGVPCAVGSSTHRANIDVCLEAFGFAHFFAALTTAEDVDAGKPDPAVYRLAARRLAGASPDTPASDAAVPKGAVVFEDAPVGIEAGLRAGMKVVGVAGTHPEETLARAGAHRIVRRLDELQVADLEALWKDGADEGGAA